METASITDHVFSHAKLLDLITDAGFDPNDIAHICFDPTSATVTLKAFTTRRGTKIVNETGDGLVTHDVKVRVA